MKLPSASSGEGGKYQCKDVTGSTDPWLVEWEPPQRVRLQSRAQKGVILVRYSGCDLEVLYGCEAEGGYHFTETTRSRQTEYINNEKDLFAKLPIGALKLAAEFQQGDKWSLDYVLVGTQETNVDAVDRASLKGHCAQATHFIQGMAVGAFELGSAAHRKGSAEVALRKAGAGASSGGEAGVLRQDGRYEKCIHDETEASDKGCQAIVQLYLQPVTGAFPEPVIACPEGTEYQDGQCIRTKVVAHVDCPQGTVARDGKCVKTEVVTETQINCPALSHFVEGQGCVGNSVPSNAATSPSPQPTSTGTASSNRSDEVKQPDTNLYWLRCPVGQTWNGSSCSGEAKTMTWNAAKSACPSGYRLPTRQEFVDLLGDCDSNVRSGKYGYCKKCSASSSCSSMFLSDTGWYWSSSPDDDSLAWPVLFSSGVVLSYAIGHDSYVRCVRSGP